MIRLAATVQTETAALLADYGLNGSGLAGWGLLFRVHFWGLFRWTSLVGCRLLRRVWLRGRRLVFRGAGRSVRPSRQRQTACEDQSECTPTRDLHASAHFRAGVNAIAG